MTKVLDGIQIAKAIHKDLRQKINKLSTPPGLGIVLVGDNKVSNTYIKRKQIVCAEVGIMCEVVRLGIDVSSSEVAKKIELLNKRDDIHGIVLQLPLPNQLTERSLLELINPLKDVDGLTASSLGRLVSIKDKNNLDNVLVSPTALAVLRLIKETKIDLVGKHVVIVGRSNLVGKPLSFLLLLEDVTVTICHSKTKNLKVFTNNADILVSAAGKAELVDKDWVKHGSVVIDVGTNYVNGKLVGDIDFDSVESEVSWITPVPGGVGPLTVAFLLSNVVKAFSFLTSLT